MCQNTCIVGNYDIYVPLRFNGWQNHESHIKWAWMKFIWLMNLTLLFLLLYRVLYECVCVCLPVVNTAHNRKLITLIVNIHCGIRIKSKFFMVFSPLLLFFSLVSVSSDSHFFFNHSFIQLGGVNILIDCHRVLSDRRSACQMCWNHYISRWSTKIKIQPSGNAEKKTCDRH